MIETHQVDDHSPMVDTNGTVFKYIEGGGPVSVVGPHATIIDKDERPDHKNVSYFCASIKYPKEEDELSYLYHDYLLPLKDDSNDSVLGSGSAEQDMSDDNSRVHHLCVNLTSCNNDFINTSCFYNLLSAVQFQSIADEPNLDNRTVSFTVSSSMTQLTQVASSVHF